MSEYKLKPPKKIEEAVVGTYKKIEDKFVDTFLEKVDGPADGAEAEPQNETPA